MNIYDIKVKDADGNMVSLSEYEGKVLLINNSATECGFTSQYDELQDMYELLKEEGFEILDFPCNQFGNQAPGTVNEIVSFCDSTYGITFRIFDKVDVNGKNESPLFAYLKAEKHFEGFDEEYPNLEQLKKVVKAIDPDYEHNSDIKWNFTKFLIDREGNVVERFEPTRDMFDVQERVKELLRA
ncbi:MAG: glutathione peroxidase [Lachnospiraceae bacterium]|nr:glutathione peroxidase [Lachnospiraceae bacterium]